MIFHNNNCQNTNQLDLNKLYIVYEMMYIVFQKLYKERGWAMVVASRRECAEHAVQVMLLNSLSHAAIYVVLCVYITRYSTILC